MLRLIRQTIGLLKTERRGSTLRRRASVFVFALLASTILLFSLLLLLSGATGGGRIAITQYTQAELSHLSGLLKKDLGNLSASGINLSKELSNVADAYFFEQRMVAANLSTDTEHIEPLLAHMMNQLIVTAENNSCGGVFVLLDMSAGKDNPDTAKAGVFLKKTQPVNISALKTKTYFLRGPASVARQYGLDLLGQWRMEYDITGEDFFTAVMETARAYPELTVDRLYYWSECITLKDNSESGFLLCVPIRCADGTVIGLCGFEVSLSMFGQLYNIKASSYNGAAFLAAVLEGNFLRSHAGLVGGDANTKAALLSVCLTYTGSSCGFSWYENNGTYGGLTECVTLYPEASPYAGQELTAAILFPREVMDEAIWGGNRVLIILIAFLLVLCGIASVFSGYQLNKPMKNMFIAIQEQSYGEETAQVGIMEIDDLFSFLAEKDIQREEKMRKLEQERQDAQKQAGQMQTKYDRAQTNIQRITAGTMELVDPDRYEMFLDSLKTLTRTQRKIFDLYLAGNGRDEILQIMGITKNTLYTHNKTLYSKLGVKSLKELLQFAALMEQENESEGRR